MIPRIKVAYKRQADSKKRALSADPLLGCFGDNVRSFPVSDSHNLVLGQATSMLRSFHSVSIALVRILDISQAKRSAAVLVACELRYKHSISKRLECRPKYNLQIAVSASPAFSNSTTPVPRERPLGSY